ncbi:recombinase RecT [Aliisedimentitalea scapharcae]|uniref:Recombinase RecT n=1 Tax=Aliisedimentitalea scapharcae TaxID=1524259 RepID=A0ABZ2XSI1_9RHOB
MNTVTNVSVAKEVQEIRSFDPGLGAYSFENLGQVVQFADLMSAAGEMLPVHLRKKPALCLAVTMRAMQWGFDPFALALETYQVKDGGIIGYQAKVFTAALRQAAGITLKYRYTGTIKMLDKPVTSSKGREIAKRTATGDRKCIVYAEMGGEVFEYETLTLDEITIKNSPLWHNDPDQQLAYYGGRGWGRRFRADVMMGAYSADEVEEMRDVTPKPATGAFAARVAQARQAQEAPAIENAPEPTTGEVVPDQDAEPVPAEKTATAELPLDDQEADTSAHWTDDIDLADAFPGDDDFSVGAKAHGAGEYRTDCPHFDDHERAAQWLGGWDQAEKAKS